MKHSLPKLEIIPSDMVYFREIIDLMAEGKGDLIAENLVNTHARYQVWALHLM